MIQNPFPGPQPYRASDRDRFYGRADLAYQLEGNLLAHRCVTVYGPSGAGKTSLMQASVVPSILDAHAVRVVRVDGWPEDEEPTRWLADAMYEGLAFGDRPAELSPGEALLAAAQRAARRSSRLVLVHLDQIEQLLHPGRSRAETEAFFDSVNRLVELPIRNLRVAFSLREDYLGRFRDHLRDHRRLLDHGFRVGPLTVAELCDAVCQAAAAGDPPQAWDPGSMHELMLQVRMPGQAAEGDAEAQSAYAQIVCRTLFQQRAEGVSSGAGEGAGEIEAEPILRSYLETTLHSLGSLREPAQRLLEDHLVTADGSRTLRTEKELLRIFSADELTPILKALEGAAVLHAAEHQGSRYFEIGHDWLGRKVFEQRQQREQQEAQRRREEEQKRELLRQQEEAAARAAKERRQRRVLGLVALTLLGVASSTGALGFWALTEARAAKAASHRADREKQRAVEKQIEAHDARLMAGFRELAGSGHLEWAMKLLPEVERPAAVRGWIELASDAVNTNALRVSLRGHENALSAAVWSPDGERVLTASADRTARVWRRDGAGEPVVLAGHKGPITSAVWSPDGERVLTSSEDGTARIWESTAGGKSVELKEHKAAVVFLALSPDGTRVVTTSRDRTARVWDLSRKGAPALLKVLGRHEGSVDYAAWSPDGKRVATASADRRARVWSVDGKDGKDGKDEPVVLEGHSLSVTFVAFRPDGRYVATASADKTARLWPAEGGAPLVLRGHDAPVRSAVWSPDGSQILTAASDPSERSLDHAAKVWSAESLKTRARAPGGKGVVHSAFISADGDRIAAAYDDYTARIFRVTGGGEPVSLKPKGGWIASAALSPDGARVVTASFDGTTRIFRADGAGEPIVLKGHAAGVRLAAFSMDGTRIVTASDDAKARVYRAEGGEALAVLKGHSDWLTGAAWSPDGTRVVTTSLDKTARVWRADGSGEPVELKGHLGAVDSAAWSPDGQHIVTASEDRSARIWNADGSGAPVELRGATDAVVRVVYSPDGKRVATSSANGTVTVWSADGKGTPIWLSAPAPVIAMAFIDEGRKLLTFASDDTTRTWMLDVERLKALLVASNADCLSAEMRVTYLGESARVAKERYAACEQAHLRTPVVAKGQTP